jgi:diguanylate cyclase (GGDEF)-like protein
MMHSVPTAPTPPQFPIRTIRLGLFLMIVLLITSTWLTWQVGRQIRSAMDDQVKVLSAAEKVEHYGTILEMSVRAVVSNGDVAAAARYRALQPQLRSTLAGLREEVHGDRNEVEAAQVEHADVELSTLEYEALELASHGHVKQARDLLHSDRYGYLVDEYSAGIEEIEARASTFMDEVKSQLNFNIWLVVGLSGTSLLLVVLGWIVLIIPTRRWGVQLDLARAAAEEAKQLLQRHQGDLKEANDRLFEQARTDTLTGLSTRLRFNEDMEEIWPQIARSGSPSVSAVMCDVDFFKQYNDTYGHLAGDEVLRRVGEALNSVRRSTDRLYRMGGEEFLLVLDKCDVRHAEARAGEFREPIADLCIPHEASPLGIVTMSVGVACAAGTSAASIQSWLSSADEALYEAKAGGRNRVAASAVSAA